MSVSKMISKQTKESTRRHYVVSRKNEHGGSNQNDKALGKHRKNTITAEQNF